MATAKLRKLDHTAKYRSLTGPAFRPDEIAVRLSTIAASLERKAEQGQQLDLEEMHFIANNLRGYSRRLRAKPAPCDTFSIY